MKKSVKLTTGNYFLAAKPSVDSHIMLEGLEADVQFFMRLTIAHCWSHLADVIQSIMLLARIMLIVG